MMFHSRRLIQSCRINYWRSLKRRYAALIDRIAAATARTLADSRSRQADAVYAASSALLQPLEPRTLLAAPNPLALSGLNGTNGFRIDGIDASDLAGNSVSDAGDVNGDGFDDIIIGARGAGPNTNAAGESYVVFGQASGFSAALDLSGLNGTNGFRIDGIATNDRSGSSVSAAGDVNGDGFDDIIIGALRADPNNRTRAGESYVVFGQASAFPAALALSSLDGSNGFRIEGIDVADYSGVSVSAAGDVNGDGYGDIIIGASGADPNGNSGAGESYVVFGKAAGFSATLALSSLNGTNGFRIDGIDAGDLSGVSVSAAGDVNGDGFDDIIIGASVAAPGGLSSAGESYVVFGQASAFPAALALSSLNGSNGFRIDGIDASDNSGASVSAAGDVNGDGFDDIIVGARGADPNNNSQAGESYVVFGKADWSGTASLNLSSLDGSNGFRIDGINMGDLSGSVSAAGDFNGDGFDDIIIGARRADPNSNFDAGESYVVFGKAAGFSATLALSSLNGSNGFRIDGIDPDDGSGVSVSAAGDVNGDGFDDIIIGAYFADPNTNSSAGESYVIFGGNFTGGVETQVGTTGNDTLTANQGAEAIDILIGGRGNDTLISDGGSDVLIGGEGDDTLMIIDTNFSDTRRIDGGTGATGGDMAGFDTLKLNGSGLYLDLTTIADNRILGIESIDLTGSGDNSLKLDALKVLNLSGDTNTLIVQGNAGDLLNFGPGWTPGVDETLLNQTFRVFSQGAATIKVDADVNTGDFTDVIDLSTLNGTNGFRIDGIDSNDRSGRRVSAAGDVNGDGFDDVIIGAEGAAPNDKFNAGESYVVFGQASGFSAALDLSSLNGTNGFRIDGIDMFDRSGSSVSAAGDVNGDGFDDIIVGAYRANIINNFADGESYVVFGKASGFAASLDLSTLNGTNGFRLDGNSGNLSGFSVSAAGDVNDDGFDDIIVGAYRAAPNNNSEAGESYVVFGKASGFSASMDLSSLNGSNGFRIDGIDAYDQSGYSVSAAGDVNGDGFDDLIVAAHFADPGGLGNAGESYVVFGQASGFPAALALNSLNGSNGFRIDGIDAGDFSGTSVSAAGDVNGDGYGDIIIGASGAAPGGLSNAGESYVVFGQASGFPAALALSSLNGSDGFRINGINDRDYSGSAVSAAGDVNGDGFDDVIIGASGADPGGNGDAGESYVVFGKATGFSATLDLSNLNGTNGFRIDGIDVSDFSGVSVSSAGDVNGDGFDDIIIGARGAVPGGESYVIFGGNFTGGIETQIGGDGNDNLIANQGAGALDILIGGRGNDTLRSDGNSDILIGGEGDDDFYISDTDFTSGPRRIDGGTGATGGPASGFDRIIISGDGRVLDLTTIPDNRITSIEAINLSGASGNNVLILDQQEVLNISNDTNTLIVQGSAGDRVRFETGWTQQANETLFGQVYQVFTKGTATLKIDAEVSLSTLVDVIDLSTLNGTNGFRIDGIDASDLSGFSVSAAGDVNGDGFDDIIIGAVGADAGGDSNTGESYVIFGKTAGFAAAIDLSTLDGTNGFRIDGIDAFDHSGRSVSAAGDVNGDGFDDIIVGADEAAPDGDSRAGESYVIFGKAAVFSAAIDLSALDGTNGFRIDGIDSGDSSGFSVSAAGDVNSDGFDDIIIGAFGGDPGGDSRAGENYVVFGKAAGFSAAIDLSTLDGTNGFRIDGIDPDDFSGFFASAAGDVNGDGFDDVIVGAYGANSNAGESYVVFGQSGGFSASLDLSTLNGSNGFRIDGIDPGDRTGRSLSEAGDVNGDGFDDIIVSAQTADPGGNSNAGESYVIFGHAVGFSAALDLSTLNGTNGFRIDGIEAGDNSGASVSAAGDVNGDGFDDIIIGAPGADAGGNSGAGESYVIFGKAGGFSAALDLSTLKGTNGFRIDGIDASDFSGSSVSAAGDVNGDGFDDILVGADAADPGGNFDAGESYVIFGGNFTGGFETQVGGDGNDNLIANQGAGAVDILIGGRGNDTLRSDGNSDIMIGGEGDDDFYISDTDFTSGPRRIDGGTGATGGPAAGFDRIIISGDGRVLDLTTIPDNRITGIEAINLNGASGDNLLILNQQEILNISNDTNTLIVQGSAGDYILFDFGWTLQPNETLFGQTYRVFTKGNATLKLDADVIVRTMWMEIDSTTVTEGGAPATATIRRSGTVGNRTYTLSTNIAGHVNIPASVVIPDGQSSITFPITAIEENVDDGNQPVIITAASGGTSSSSTITVINNDTPPTITLGTISGQATLPGKPFRLLPFATVTDPDAGDLNGFRADVRIVAGLKSYDRLWLLNESGQRLTAGASIILSGVNVGTVTETGSAVRVTLNSNANLNHLTSIYNRIEYENVGTNVTSDLIGPRTLAMRVIDTDTRIDIAYYNLDVKGNPQISLDTTAVKTALPGAPVRLLPFATVTDVDTTNLNGFRADVRIVAGRKSYDRLWLLDEAGQRLSAGASIILSGVNVGTVTENGLAVRVTLNANATLNHLRNLYNRVEYENVGSNPTIDLVGKRVLAMRVIDTDTLFDIAYFNVYVQGRPVINVGSTSGTTAIPGSPYRLLPFATVTDIDSGNANGYRVDMYFDTGRKANDRLFLLDENGQRLNNGDALILNGITVGTVVESGLRIKVLFNSNATFNHARTVYNRIEYENLTATSDPSLLGTRRLELRVRDTDGNIGSAYYDLDVTA